MDTTVQTSVTVEEPPRAEEPKALETPEQRRQRERAATSAEVYAIEKAYQALHTLDQAALRRAFTWLHDRLEHTGPDPWGDDTPF